MRDIYKLHKKLVTSEGFEKVESTELSELRGTAVLSEFPTTIIRRWHRKLPNNVFKTDATPLYLESTDEKTFRFVKLETIYIAHYEEV